uniref:Cupin domain protein n=1 Tax=Pithovirus LCPAC101 TaxID=2506586 RepID=A0A481Z3A3_9VIRU|nr:MAG: cupin domain protein [Pithovirus LCPAC101]
MDLSPPDDMPYASPFFGEGGPRNRSPVEFTDTSSRINRRRNVTNIDTSRYSPIRRSRIPPINSRDVYEDDTDDVFNITQGGFIQSDVDRNSGGRRGGYQSRSPSARPRYEISPPRYRSSSRSLPMTPPRSRRFSPGSSSRSPERYTPSYMLNRYDEEEAEEVDVINMEKHFQIDESYTGVLYTGKMQVITRNIMPGEYMTLSTNQSSDLTVYVVEGNGELNVGEPGDRVYYDLSQSDLCIIPANNSFYIYNSNGDTLSLILTYSSEQYSPETIEERNPSTGVPKLFI